MIRHARTALQAALALALAAGALTAPVGAQHVRTLSYGTAQDVGMSPAVLDGAVGLYREAVDRGDLVGAVVLVARQGRIVVHEAIGMSDKEQGLPMERNTMFRMASNTKPVVATGAATLVESRELRYDELVREYIPSWDNYRAGFITLGHLLSHTGGLRIPTLFLEPLGEHPTLQGEAARFGEVGAEVAPGTSYSYSNPGFNTVAALVEIASGKRLEAYLDETIYTPLGMEDSYNYRAGHRLDGKLSRMGAVYYERGDDGKWVPGGTPGGPVAYPFARGSGGMISTTRDYAIFCQMFLNGGEYGGARIISSETVELMTSPKPATNGGYGYGWAIGDGWYGHSGSDGTNAWIDPEHEIIGLVFTQTPRGRNPVDRFRELVTLSVER